jgi:hypothetical protein
MLAYAGSYQIITYRHDDGSFVLLGIPHEWDLDMFCGVWKQVSFNEAEELLLRGETLLTRGGAYVEYDEKLKRNCAKYVLEDKSDMLRGLYRKRGEEAEY